MTVETVELAPGYRIARLIRGGWQLAGDHGPVERSRAVADMAAFPAAGIDAFDCADIYTGVEEMIGDFREQFADLAAIKVHTKLAPDADALPVSRDQVRAIVDRSRRRLRQDRLDLVQLHWWRYEVDGAIETAGWLRELQGEGAIDRLGATNFDTPRLRAILDAGVPLVSHQVQYSLLDRRPENGMTALLAERGMGLLAYGTLAGGFLTDRWLGQREPDVAALGNRSLVKYKLIIDDFGGWAPFQGLLRVLRGVGDRHGVPVSAVATRWVLDRPTVAAAIVGARYARHLPDSLLVFGLMLGADDRAAIDAVLDRHAGPRGDTFELERDRSGPHGRIMKYNLNAGEDRIG